MHISKNRNIKAYLSIDIFIDYIYRSMSIQIWSQEGRGVISELPGAEAGLGLLCAGGRPALGGTLRKHLKFENANGALRVSLQLSGRQTLPWMDSLHASPLFFFLPGEKLYFSFASPGHSNLLEERRELANSGPGSEQLTCWLSSPPSFAELCPCRQVTAPGAGLGGHSDRGSRALRRLPKRQSRGCRSGCPRRHKRCRCPVLSRR